MIRFSRSPKARRPTMERAPRFVLAAIMAGLAISLLLLGREVFTGAPPRPPVRTAADAPNEPQDKQVYTGSILFMTAGNTCRQYLFDNVSGRLSDTGMIDCERGAYHPALGPAKTSSSARVNVISSGFRAP